MAAHARNICHNYIKRWWNATRKEVQAAVFGGLARKRDEDGVKTVSVNLKVHAKFCPFFSSACTMKSAGCDVLLRSTIYDYFQTPRLTLGLNNFSINSHTISFSTVGLKFQWCRSVNGYPTAKQQTTINGYINVQVSPSIR
ncbi:hypothetical protein YC2023_048667 [Brassica napus]